MPSVNHRGPYSLSVDTGRPRIALFGLLHRWRARNSVMRDALIVDQLVEETVASFERVRLVARLVVGGDGRVTRSWPVLGGDLNISAGGAVALRANGPAGEPRDAVLVRAADVRGISFGSAFRRATRLNPWLSSDPRPTRIGQLLRGRRDLVLVLADRPEQPGECVLLAFELWRAPSPSALATIEDLSRAAKWPSSVADLIPAALHRRLMRVARGYGEPHPLVGMSQ